MLPHRLIKLMVMIMGWCLQVGLLSWLLLLCASLHQITYSPRCEDYHWITRKNPRRHHETDADAASNSTGSNKYGFQDRQVHWNFFEPLSIYGNGICVCKLYCEWSNLVYTSLMHNRFQLHRNSKSHKVAHHHQCCLILSLMFVNLPLSCYQFLLNRHPLLKATQCSPLRHPQWLMSPRRSWKHTILFRLLQSQSRSPLSPQH